MKVYIMLKSLSHMKFIQLIILAILCLIVPSVLIYTSSSVISNPFSREYDSVQIKGHFIGNISENQNTTLVSGSIEMPVQQGGFVGSINGTIENFKVNESLVEGQFKGFFGGTLIELAPNPSFYILVLLFLFLVFYSLIDRPEEIAGKIDRLFLIFSIGLGIDFGANLLFLKILNVVPFTIFSSINFWWQPSLGLIFSALVVWLIFLIISLISRKVDTFNKRNNLLNPASEQLILFAYVVTLVSFGIALISFLVEHIASTAFWFIFSFPKEFRNYGPLLLIGPLMVIFSAVVLDFSRKVFPKSNASYEILVKSLEKELYPKFIKVLQMVFFFLFCIFMAGIILIKVGKITSENQETYLSSTLLFLVPFVAIVGMYFFYQTFKSASEKGILTRNMLTQEHKSNFFTFIRSIISMIYLFFIILLIPKLMHLMFGQFYYRMGFTFSEILIDYLVPLAILFFIILGIFAFIFPYLFLIGFKPITIAILSFFASWGISESTSMVVEFATKNIQIFILSSFLVAVFSYIFDVKKEQLLEKYAYKITKCFNCSKEINEDFEYCPWCSVVLSKTQKFR